MREDVLPKRLNLISICTGWEKWNLRENSSPQTETKFVQLQNKNGKSLICGVPHAKKIHIKILILKPIKFLFLLKFQPVLLLLGFFNPQPVKSSLYSTISSQTSLLQPPPLLRLYGFLCKKTTAPVSSYLSPENVLLRRITAYQKSLLSKAGVVWPHYGGNHQGTEVSNMLHYVVSHLWTFHPAFIENTAQDILLLLWHRILNNIQPIFHTANLQSNACETHMFYSKSLICVILKCWRENQDYQEMFSSLSSIPFIH